MSKSRNYPSHEDDLLVLLGEKYHPDPEKRLPTSTEMERFSENLDSPSRADLKALHRELVSRYDSDRIGSLMNTAVLNRDRQLQTLARAGVDTILDLLAEGYFLPRIAQILDVSHAVLAQFVKKTVPPLLLAEYEALAVDKQVDNAMLNLEIAEGRDNVQQAKSMADFALKIAKARSQKWVEQKPQGDTYVQQNFAGAPDERNTGSSKPVAGFQLILRDPAELKPMKPVPQVTRKLHKTQNDDPLIVNGEFRPVPRDDGSTPLAMEHAGDASADEDTHAED